jgi:hypothetical protein
MQKTRKPFCDALGRSFRGAVGILDKIADELIQNCLTATREGADFPTVWQTLLRLHSLVAGPPIQSIEGGRVCLKIQKFRLSAISGLFMIRRPRNSVCFADSHSIEGCGTRQLDAALDARPSAGMLAPRQHHRVNDALGRNRRLALQLGVERKAMSKPALCATNGASPTNARNSSATSANSGLSAKNSAATPAKRARWAFSEIAHATVRPCVDGINVLNIMHGASQTH